APHRGGRDGDDPAAAGEPDLRAGGAGRGPAHRLAQPAGAARRVLAPARADQRRGAGAGPQRAQRGPVPVPARVPGGPGLRVDHRLLLADLQRERPGAGHRRGAQRQRRPAVHPPAVRPDHRARPQRRQRRHHHRPGRAARGVRGAGRPRLHRVDRGAAAADRRDPGDGLDAVVRPHPAGQLQRADPAGGLERVHLGRAAGAHQPGDPGDLSPRVDVQADRRGRGAGERPLQPGEPVHGGLLDHPGRHGHPAAELQRQRVRHRGHREPARGAAAVLQHRLRRARAPAGRGGAARPGRGLRHRHAAGRRPDAGGRLHHRRHREHRGAAAVEPRAARRGAHADAERDGGGGHRQRRHGHGPVPGQRDPEPGPDGRRHHRPRPARPGGQPPDGGRAHRDDGQQREQLLGRRQAPRRADRGQDRHGRVGAGPQDDPPARLVRRVRPRREPAGGGGRDRRGGRRPQQPRGHRRHRGGPAGPRGDRGGAGRQPV
ncbi:MAG: Cell division protein FtsI [Peptidoglycan synthetase], partial [uncultured Pseudonocardia sp.]